jgi:hypothetical protein
MVVEAPKRPYTHILYIPPSPRHPAESRIGNSWSTRREIVRNLVLLCNVTLSRIKWQNIGAENNSDQSGLRDIDLLYHWIILSDPDTLCSGTVVIFRNEMRYPRTCSIKWNCWWKRRRKVICTGLWAQILRTDNSGYFTRWLPCKLLDCDKLQWYCSASEWQQSSENAMDTTTVSVYQAALPSLKSSEAKPGFAVKGFRIPIQ